jgi:uncharacterized membrane protein YbhN (UPF0104 family)
MIRSALRHPVLSSAAAAAASVAAILGIGLIAHLSTVVHAIGDQHPSWLGVTFGAEILSFPSYALTYRTIVRRYGHQYLTARVTVHMVLAGFGLFAVLGGFSLDRIGLQRLGADPEGAPRWVWSSSSPWRPLASWPRSRCLRAAHPYRARCCGLGPSVSPAPAWSQSDC